VAVKSLVGLLLLLAACASPAVNSPDGVIVVPSEAGELEQQALEIVRRDSEVAAFLDATDFVVEPLQMDGDLAHLLLRFETEMSNDGIWDRTCEGVGSVISGGHFVVDLAAGAVAETSPRYGPASCIALPGEG
jgi:hypothetical protein